MAHVHPLANGLRTDHPVPGLPFVDDSHIPLDDGPEAIEAVGRHEASGMWGRYDRNRQDDSWYAFTTDPLDHSLGWSVRYHPEHGRTVLLMRDGDTSTLHNDWGGEALLFRAGCYWWDGTTWYRPGQVWNPVEQDHERRKARAAVTVSAADMLDGRADADKAYVGKVLTFDPEEEAPENWGDHLALWAKHHQKRDGALPLDRCVVDIASPELTGAQLLGVPEMAELGGITASTLRAYISRGNSEVPQPQAMVNGRVQWARAVADDWVEARQRSYEGIKATMSAGDRDNLSPGAAAVRDRFAANFHSTLWGRPDVRKRWILRARNEGSVREIADTLAWDVAVSLDRVLPPDVLGPTVKGAILNGFAEAIAMNRPSAARQKEEPGEKSWFHLHLTVPVAKMLDWFIRHYPESAHHYIGDIVREAHDRWEIPAKATLRTLRQALSLDGKLSQEARETYFALLMPREQHAD
ncbi:helix-turn-helix transcriptional regulator [Streptomyces virginiae]|uniref:helix-turn-helix transcriptional regulator n=1 Tax=Streptomyces virginiae TaxID=1961 RepID=UPI003448602C